MPVNNRPKLLSQRRPLSNTPSVLYSPPANTTTEITEIYMMNNQNGNAGVSLFVNRDSSTVTDVNALYRSTTVSGNSTLRVERAGIILSNTAGALVGRVVTGDTITFTVFGIETTETS